MAKKFKLAVVLSCIVTVVLAVGYALCAFDASFVVMQRHNRARIVTFLARSQGKAQG